MKKRKICIVTGSRADYGLLYWLLKEIQADSALELQLIATGMHMDKSFGYTYKVIEKDFELTRKIPMPLNNDQAYAVSTAMGSSLPLFAKAYTDLQPDILVVLGDRYEILAATIPGVIANIPIAHIHGGETTEGAVDEVIRHSLTKMSHLHFCANKVYKKRIMQLGENPKHIFNVGALGLDNIKKLPLLSKEAFEDSIHFKLNKKNILVTFHPQTIGEESSQEQFSQILLALSGLKNTNIIFTKTNSDVDGKIINTMIDTYVSENVNCVSFISLGQIRYLSALQYVDIVLGNSSSGLLEVPSFKIATVDIGERQKGRIKAKSIISCKCSKKAIEKAIEKAYSQSFKKKLKHIKNPFGTHGASKKIVKVLKKKNLKNILQKKFYDLV